MCVSSADDMASIRRSYGTGELTEDSLAPSWFEQLRLWYAAASASELITEPNAMQVATVDQFGHPDVRTVLARGVDPAGVVFYTNYDSAKGEQLAGQPWAAARLARAMCRSWQSIASQGVARVSVRMTRVIVTCGISGQRLANA